MVPRFTLAVLCRSAAAGAPPCDRACMTHLVDRYLDALVRHENTVDALPLGGGTSNLQAGEIFKIRAGKIHDIEAMGARLPYGTKSGWH